MRRFQIDYAALDAWIGWKLLYHIFSIHKKITNSIEENIIQFCSEEIDITFNSKGFTEPKIKDKKVGDKVVKPKKQKYEKIKSRTMDLYDNCKMFAPNGTHICNIAQKKVKWYIDRGLAEIITADSGIAIRLLFNPKGKGHAGDQYYLSEKQNRCVVCGFEEVSRFSVIPHNYRTHFADEIKTHSYHDIVLLCGVCHHKATRLQTFFHKFLMKEYNVKDDHSHIKVNEKMKKIYNIACALIKYKDKLPSDKILNYRNELKELLEIENLTDDDIVRASKIEWRIKSKVFVSPAKLIVDCLESVEEYQHFGERWRNNFIKTMNPQFLLKGWRIDHPIMKLGDELLE